MLVRASLPVSRWLSIDGSVGPLPGRAVDPVHLQALEVDLRRDHAGVPQQVPQDQQRIGLQQVEREPGRVPGRRGEPSGLPVMALHQLLQGGCGEGVPAPVRRDIGEPRLEALTDPASRTAGP